VLLADAGRLREAWAILKDEYQDDFPVVGSGGEESLQYMYVMAEIAATSDDRDIAAALFDRLLPNAGAFVVTFSQFYGSIDRCLGRLATVLGTFDDAERYIAIGAASHEQIGAPLFQARSWTDEAELCLKRNGPGDLARAGELIERAVRAAHEHQALGVERYASRLLEADD
jgi:hypothetical protein